MTAAAQSEKVIQDLLIKCQYKYKDLSKRDILAVLSYFKELFVKIEKHVYSNGLVKDLVSLTGTIPVTFKNNRYNIPIQLFLSDLHPHDPPLVYVRPTPDMRINVSETVDSNGRVYLPYLNEWKYPTSDLYMLLNFLTIKFSEQTPLYSKPAGASGSGIAQPPPPPRPVSGSSYPINSNPPYPIQNNQPPYPIDSFRPTYPLPNTNTNVNNYSLPPPYPVMENSMPSYSSNIPSYPHPQNPYYPKQVQPPPPIPNPPQQLSSLKSNSNSNIYGQTRPSLNPYTTPTPATDINNRSPYADDTIKPEYYMMSIISAVQDKMRKKFRDVCEEKQAEIDSLKRIKNELEQSSRNLNLMLDEAHTECADIEEMTRELKHKCTQVNESINRQQLREKTDVEDAVITTTPLYRQLLQLFVEEMAIQDFIYYLGEGLAHKTITLDNFLKQVRFLSRKQFFLRATMQLAREKAGLPA